MYIYLYGDKDSISLISYSEKSDYNDNHDDDSKQYMMEIKQLKVNLYNFCFLICLHNKIYIERKPCIKITD